MMDAGTTDKMELWEILIPMLRPNGKPIRARYHRAWNKKVRKIAGGLTILTPAKGQWISPSGEEFHERMIPVRVSCSEEQMQDIANMTAGYYNQQAIMFYRISDKCFIKHYNN